jgi:hypothetical protein
MADGSQMRLATCPKTYEKGKVRSCSEVVREWKAGTAEEAAAPTEGPNRGEVEVVSPLKRHLRSVTLEDA